MNTAANERRRYRFRAWHKLERELYPVVAVVRGGVILQDKIRERTCPRSDVVIMQFSGVTDTAGQDIYEGDILELDGDERPNNKQVVLDDGAFQLQSSGQGEAVVLQHDLIDRHNGRVVGNIYQSSQK